MSNQVQPPVYKTVSYDDDRVITALATAYYETTEKYLSRDDWENIAEYLRRWGITMTGRDYYDV